MIGFALLLAQTVLVVRWLGQLAAHYALVTALFVRDLHRAYRDIRPNNLSSRVIQSGDTKRAGAQHVVIQPTAIDR